MFRLFILSLAVVAQVDAAARAQVVPKELQEMQTAMVAAQAKSMRLADEAMMTCEAIEKELVTSMNDPAIQTYAAKTDAVAKKDLAVLEKAKKPMTLEVALAMATGLAPTGNEDVQDQAAMMKPFISIMPQLMRSQRLIQLAFVQQCAWATGANLSVPPQPRRSR